MPRVDAFNEEFGQDPVARTGERFWSAFSVALVLAGIGVLAFAWSAADGRLRRSDLFQPRILKDRSERRASAVRERIRSALTIVCDESPNGHGLHCMVGDADRAVDNAGRDAEQNHVVLRVDLRRRLFHGILRSPPPGEHRHPASSWPCVGARAMRLAAAAALAALVAAAFVALAEAMGKSFSIMAAPSAAGHLTTDP